MIGESAAGRLVLLTLLVGSGCVFPAQWQRPAALQTTEATAPAIAVEHAPCGVGQDRPPTTLDRFLARPDAGFRSEIVATDRARDGVLLRLSVSSQEWQGTRWRHPVLLFIPAEREADDLLLMVLRQGPPTEADPAALRTISEATGTSAAFLFDLPNQPLSMVSRRIRCWRTPTRNTSARGTSRGLCFCRWSGAWCGRWTLSRSSQAQSGWIFAATWWRDTRSAATRPGCRRGRSARCGHHPDRHRRAQLARADRASSCRCG